jgi:hypothetical protein
VAGLERGKFLADVEQLADEILDVRSEGDDELGFRFAVEGSRVRTGVVQAGPEPGVSGLQLVQKRGVEPGDSFPRVKVLEGEPEREVEWMRALRHVKSGKQELTAVSG